VKSIRSTTLALAALLCAAGAPAVAATTAPITAPSLPNIPLHTEVVVEVNKLGQVVRVKSTKPCKVQSFNVQTFGNALQMWIRKPDGSAQVGLYRVSYDYDPKTQKVERRIALVSLGGDWGNEPGAANVMIENARKQALEMEHRQQEENAKLPSLNQIRGSPSPKPTAAQTLPPI
jgi:NADH dehydrogenase/NADH:ubiquinone oxidoreductase subunit G